MPGFTPMSMFPRMWAASGLDYPALVDRLLATALARRARPQVTDSGTSGTVAATAAARSTRTSASGA